MHGNINVNLKEVSTLDDLGVSEGNMIWGCLLEQSKSG